MADEGQGRTLLPSKLLELQFVALRAEILETKRQNFQTIGFGVASLPLGNLLAEKSASLLYLALPAVVVVAALMYMGSNNAIIRCGEYIRTEVEPNGIGWEQWLENTPSARNADRVVSVAIRTLFAIYLLIALWLAGAELWRQVDPSLASPVISLYVLLCGWAGWKFHRGFRLHSDATKERKSIAA